MTVRLGFVGAGFVAQVAHIPAFCKSPDFSCVAIADPRSDIRECVANTYSIPHQFASHTELLESGAVDAVVVTLPRRLTAGMVEDCLAHETWVLAEKPLFLNSSSAPKILSKVGNRGVCVGFMKRCDVGVESAKLMLEEQKHYLGALESMTAVCHAGDSYFGIGGDFKSAQERVVLTVQEAFPASIPVTFQHSYEQFLNVYSHTLNLSEFLSGRHVTLEGCVYTENGAGHFVGRIGSVPYVLSVSRGKAHPWTESVELRFEKAIITVRLRAAFDKNSPSSVEVCAAPDVTLRPYLLTNAAWSFDAQPGRFRDMIAGDISPIEDVLSSWRYAENCERIYSSQIAKAS